jgi:N-acetylmuramoyl-L-alanine amidase
VRTTSCVLILAATAALPFVSQTGQQPSGAPATPTPQAPAPLIPSPVQSTSPPQKAGLQLVVLDPAHGGTDPGARGTGGIRESDLVLNLAAQVRLALEKQGFSVLQTRQGNDNPSLDDRSAMINAQRGAIFLTLHVGSTGLPGTVRVYTLPDSSAAPGAPRAMLPWDRAQTFFLPMSRKLADLAQGELSLRFKGSPNTPLMAPVRQLRSIAAPAIAVELSSVSVDDHNALDRMVPGVADAIARAVAAYKPVYDSVPIGGALQ